MKVLGIVLAGLVISSGLTYGEDCSCHGVPVKNQVTSGAPVRVSAASATVITKTGSKTVSLSPGGNTDLGSVVQGDLLAIVLMVIANDPDDEVCEAMTRDAYAKLGGSLTVNEAAMVLSGNGTWVGTVTSFKQGTISFSISGTIVDDASQHPDSNDTDLVLKGEYKSSIKISKK